MGPWAHGPMGPMGPRALGPAFYTFFHTNHIHQVPEAGSLKKHPNHMFSSIFLDFVDASLYVFYFSYFC